MLIKLELLISVRLNFTQYCPSEKDAVRVYFTQCCPCEVDLHNAVRVNFTQFCPCELYTVLFM